MLNLDHKLVLDAAAIKSPNLASRFEKADLDRIGNAVIDGFDRDKQSRSAWERRNEAGMDLALQISKAKNFPWPNCSNVAFPLVTIAAMQFHARAYPAIISGNDIVKCRVIGEDKTGEITERAERISTHMSWQCLEEDQAWEEQHDRGLLNLSIVGCNFLKTYFDAREAHNTSELVLAKDLVVNYWAKSVETTPRKTQLIPLYRNDIYEKVRRGTFRDVLEEAWFLGVAQSETSQARLRQDQRQGTNPPQPDETTPFCGLEQHVLMDLDGDGYAEPYIITVERQSKSVLRIVTGFDREEDVERNAKGQVICIHRLQYYTKVPFIPSPDGGIYDIGFGVLLGPLNESVNTAINQLFDAGTMSTTAGGFLGRGAKVKGGVYTFSPLEWKRLDATGDDIQKSIFPLPVREPSTVLFQLLGLLIDYTNRISGSTDMMVGENPGQNTPAETSRTMVQQGEKIFNAIFKRVWRAMKEEFKKLYVLNAINLPDSYSFGPTGQKALRADYLGNPNSVAPAADPNLTSEAQQFQQAQAIASRAATVPGYDPMEVERRVLKHLKVDGIEKLFPGPEKFPPGKDVKLQIAELRAQEADGKLKAQQQQFLIEMQEQARLDDAQIAKIEGELRIAEAAAQGDQTDRQINAMNTMLGFMKHSQAERQTRIDALTKELQLRVDDHHAAADREVEKEKVAAMKAKSRSAA